jgi:hypothetical protein
MTTGPGSLITTPGHQLSVTYNSPSMAGWRSHSSARKSLNPHLPTESERSELS